MYEPKGSLVAYLPLSMEWMVLALALLVATPFVPLLGLVGLAMAATSLAFVGHRASKAKLPARHDNLGSRLIITGLTLLQPLCRGWTRYKTVWQLRKCAAHGVCPVPLAEDMPHDEREMPRVGFVRKVAEIAGVFSHRLTFHRYFWNNKGVEREQLLSHILAVLTGLRMPFTTDTGFASISAVPPWDLSARTNLFTVLKLRVTAENHGGYKRFVRLAGTILPTGRAVLLLAVLAAAAAALVPVSAYAAVAVATAGALFAGWMLWGLFRAASLVTMLVQYLMVRGPGGSLEEPVEERLIVRASAPSRRIVDGEGDPDDLEALIPTSAAAKKTENALAA